jgi:hypothetical protein
MRLIFTNSCGPCEIALEISLAWLSVAARSARRRNSACFPHLVPDSPTNLAGFGDDAVLVHRENLTIPHDELPVDHAGLDVGRLTIVNPRGHDAPRRREAGALRVQDDEVCLLPNIERAEELYLLHRSRTALRGVFERVFGLRPEAGFASSREIRFVGRAILMTSNRYSLLA